MSEDEFLAGITGHPSDKDRLDLIRIGESHPELKFLMPKEFKNS